MPRADAQRRLGGRSSVRRGASREILPGDPKDGAEAAPVGRETARALGEQAIPESLKAPLTSPAPVGSSGGGARVACSCRLEGIASDVRRSSDHDRAGQGPRRRALARPRSSTRRGRWSWRRRPTPGALHSARGRRHERLRARAPRHTNCPYKGTANYFTLRAGDDLDANAVWTYETPKAGRRRDQGHLAFYPDKVEITRSAA